MTLHQLKVFATVAKLRSFTQAAETLRVSQPSVTLVVQSLGRELEVKLFEKLGNRIHLTSAGEGLLRLAEEIVAKVEGIKEAMDEIKGLKKGKISVGGSGLAAATILTVAVQKFKEEHPGVEVILSIQRSPTLEKKLLEGELDLAILGWAPRSQLLIGELYREEDIVVIAPPNHPFTKRRSVPLKLIAKEPLIVHDSSTIRDMVERRFADLGLPFTPFLAVNLQSGSRDALKDAVANGIGISFQAKCHVMWELKAGRLKVLKVPELKLKRAMYIAVHRNRQSSSLIPTFMDFLKNYKH